MLDKKQVDELRRIRQFGIGRMLLLARKDFVNRLYEKMTDQGHDSLPMGGGALLPFIDLEGARSTELARRMGVTKQAVAKALKELEDAGLVVRTVDETDGRAFRVNFTAKGIEHLLAIHQAIDAVEADYAQLIGVRSLDTLRATLAKIAYPQARKE